ncbi:hypothetical protein EDB95_3043 [Dinghuibacter silviterrae]|uniref:Uncharacterized protein n=1 Tax=Dinghuibacter silviterrae TaxID=1539049 RepID=A0A4R8DVF0_9BACT|nr:hypothetical protein EDB95_3043 [Dinghuibacter silviterrae]
MYGNEREEEQKLRFIAWLLCYGMGIVLILGLLSLLLLVFTRRHKKLPSVPECRRLDPQAPQVHIALPAVVDFVVDEV